MAEYKKKNQNNFLYSPIVLILLFILLGFLIYKVIGLVKKEKETAEKKEMVLDKINNLRERQADLSKDIDKFKTEAGIEDAIREKYQVVKQGEKMVVIVDSDKNKSSEPVKNKKHGFLNWLRGLFNN